MFWVERLKVQEIPPHSLLVWSLFFLHLHIGMVEKVGSGSVSCAGRTASGSFEECLYRTLNKQNTV